MNPVLTDKKLFMQFDNETEHVWYFLVQLGKRGNLFADLSRVVIEGYPELGKRVEKQVRVLGLI